MNSFNLKNFNLKISPKVINTFCEIDFSLNIVHLLGYRMKLFYHKNKGY